MVLKSPVHSWDPSTCSRSAVECNRSSDLDLKTRVSEETKGARRVRAVTFHGGLAVSEPPQGEKQQADVSIPTAFPASLRTTCEGDSFFRDGKCLSWATLRLCPLCPWLGYLKDETASHS